MKVIRMVNINDNQLVNKCVKNNRNAYAELYNRYKGYCYTICIRYGVKDLDTKDYLQTIFSEIFNSLKTFDQEKASFKTWMSRITVNQILNLKRKNKIVFSEEIEKNEPKYISEYEGHDFYKMDYEIILKILSQMPENYLVVFNLSIIDGFSHKEISTKLGITEGQSRILLLRGRQWAMKKLGNYYKNDNGFNFQKSQTQ